MIISVRKVIISVNQLSVNGTVSGWCEKLAQQISDHSSYSTGRPVGEMNDESESRISLMLCQSQRIHFRSMFQYRETCCDVMTKDAKLVFVGKDFTTIHDMD